MLSNGARSLYPNGFFSELVWLNFDLIYAKKTFVVITPFHLFQEHRPIIGLALTHNSIIVFPQLIAFKAMHGYNIYSLFNDYKSFNFTPSAVFQSTFPFDVCPITTADAADGALNS